jgi:hypothetical protein
LTRPLDALCLALLILISVATGHLFMKTALATPATVARAEALKGM